MQDRAKVICHMMTTIDGKIVIDFDGNEDYEKAGDEYDRLVMEYGPAWGCGRATFQEEIPVDFSKYQGVSVTYQDKVIQPPEGAHLCVAFDRYGKLRWESNQTSYAGVDNLLLEAITEQVKPEFLAYLDELGIPYLFAGKQEFDPELFLQKLKRDYHVDRFVLCGGAQINGEFLRRGLVDEISLVIGPAVAGNREGLTFAGVEDTTGFPQYFKLKEARPIQGNGLVILYKA